MGVGQMGGKGSFSDPRIGLFINQTPDFVTPKLAALLEYQLSLRPPKAPKRAIDPVAASRGKSCSATKLDARPAINGRPSPTS